MTVTSFPNAVKNEAHSYVILMILFLLILKKYKNTNAT